MNEEILYTRDDENESKVNSENDLQFCNNSEKSKSDENMSLKDDNTNTESSESVLDEEKVLSNDDDDCIPGTNLLSFQDLMDQIDSSIRKYNFDEHMKKCANIDMPLNWTEIASVLFFLSLKTSFRRDRENTNLRIIEEHISEMSDCLNPITDGMVDVHCVGSTAEGVDIPGHSDLDIMMVCKSFECYGGLSEGIYIHKNDTTKFISDRRNASSGYTLLWDIQNSFNYIDGDEVTVKMNPYLKYDNEDSLVTVSFPNKDIKAFPLKNLLINQNKIKDLLRNAVPIPLSLIGPALNATLNLPSEIVQHLLKIIDFVKVIFDDKSELKNVEKVLDILKVAHVDIVWAIPFESKAITQQWSGRRRRHHWPPKELLQEISQMSGHVVPVGKKGSKFENYEFRICYTLAEIKLIRSLNEVQTLIFMILRVYAKDRKGAFPNISSYIIKNMILWLAESVEPSYFKPENMIPLIKSTLQVIKRCAEKGSLPNYMIPSRNLFDGKVEEKERQRLIDALSHATKEGCDDILRQFDESISEIIAGVRSDKLHTFVEKQKEMERKKRVLFKLSTELCHRHRKTYRNILTTMAYVRSLCGPRTQALLHPLIAPFCRIS